MGGILGRSADLLIIDDPIKNASEAYSAAYQERLRDWYQSTAATRLEPGGSVIVNQAGRHLKSDASLRMLTFVD
jgi:hypothetical protein